MKKSRIALSLTLLPFAAFATPFNGFYAGVGIGGSQASFETKQHLEVIPLFTGTPILDVVVSSQPDLTDQSFAGNLEIGFSHVFDQHFYLALEADADTQNLSDNNPIAVNEILAPLLISGTSEAKLTNEFAVTLNPGFVLGQNILFYGKIGPAWGNIETKGSLTYNHTIAGFVTVNGATSFKQDGYEDGLRLGLGIERYISSQFSLKLEYLHTDYDTVRSGEQSASGVSGTLPGVTGTVSDSDKIKANANSIMLGLNYHFGA